MELRSVRAVYKVDGAKAAGGLDRSDA